MRECAVVLFSSLLVFLGTLYSTGYHMSKTTFSFYIGASVMSRFELGFVLVHEITIVWVDRARRER